ncbi:MULTISPECIES: EthD domain-containing protein [unclassified Pseudomonas]|uniref:EthD domain-containing protein n=1 Tax=unclassified Pseudomonas TaxID=196821 RepID=UPI0025E4C3C5|nr:MULTISPECIES: EthD domain-containing protein [unclassified Pseudomonas]
MTPVTTLALLSKKNDLSARLFFRYWRDVHGVLAARIPGFETYTQFHLGAVVRNLALPNHVSRSWPVAARFHGLAEVGFLSPAAREGLINSKVAALIQADERNLFKTSLLYNLEPGASRSYHSRPASAGSVGFVMLLGLRTGHNPRELIDTVERWLIPALSADPVIHGLHMHVLSSGDPSQWRTAGVDNQQSTATTFEAVLRIEGLDSQLTLDSIKGACALGHPHDYEALGRLHLYRIDDRHVMVENGQPTHLGLRGLDALQTITLAGADLQLQRAVTRTLYGTSPPARKRKKMGV